MLEFVGLLSVLYFKPDSNISGSVKRSIFNHLSAEADPKQLVRIEGFEPPESVVLHDK